MDICLGYNKSSDALLWLDQGPEQWEPCGGGRRGASIWGRLRREAAPTQHFAAPLSRGKGDTMARLACQVEACIWNFVPRVHCPLKMQLRVGLTWPHLAQVLGSEPLAPDALQGAHPSARTVNGFVWAGLRVPQQCRAREEKAPCTQWAGTQSRPLDSILSGSGSLHCLLMGRFLMQSEWSNLFFCHG
jgi:hypothetical protein